MTDALIEAGTLEANLDERSITGLLLPWEEVGNSNLGKFAIARDAVTIPRDPSVVTLNMGHDRTQPVGRATALNKTDKGIVASFKVADTDEGDAYLLEVAEGRLKKLSAEVSGIVIRSGKAIAGALFGAAAVEAGAFPSAALMAADAGDITPTVADALTADELTALRALIAQMDATQTTSEAPAEEANSQENKEDPVNTETTTAAVGDVTATIPGTLNAGAAKTKTGSNTVQQVTAALAAFHRNGDTSGIQALTDTNAGDTLFAALSDIKSTYTGSVGANILQPQWVGDVWSTRTYSRKYAPLIGSAPLTSYKVDGFRFTTEADGGTWTGDKTAIPSNSPATEAVTVNATRWAGGHDIAREFVDFGVQEFWDSYFRQMSNGYAKASDGAVVSALNSGASTVTAGTVPSGVNSATVSLIDGALAVLDADATPAFAIVAKDVYRSLLLQGKDDLIATLSLSLGLEDGSLAGFRIVPSSTIDTGKVLVGSKDAATFYEMPGAPIRTNALDISKGGQDYGFFGYYAVLINNKDALALVTPAT